MDLLGRKGEGKMTFGFDNDTKEKVAVATEQRLKEVETRMENKDNGLLQLIKEKETSIQKQIDDIRHDLAGLTT